MREIKYKTERIKIRTQSIKPHHLGMAKSSLYIPTYEL